MEELYNNVKCKRELRESLIRINQLLKEGDGKRKLQEIVKDDGSIFVELLQDEDPKVRKNAALILGKLEAPDFLEKLYQAYEEETTLFIKSDYLKAISFMDYERILGKLKERFNELSAQETTPENEKHIREETAALQKMIIRRQKTKKHIFSGALDRYDIILTTNKFFREITARQVPEGKITLIPLGVKIRGVKLESILPIRTYRELLFPIKCEANLSPEPEATAKELAGSDMISILERAHNSQDTFYFRFSIHGKMPLDKRGVFIKKCSYALEKLTNRRLVNSASDYEVEIRLMERKDGSFYPLLKMHTLSDKRFQYRKYSISTSIHPSMAALLAELAKPWLKENAQVLDPFCGVGTMLIERNQLVKAGKMYGLDIFGEAIEKARVNTELSEKEIHYINRNFFGFTHKYELDEIFTNMPSRGRKTREEQDEFYQDFFEKAVELLKQEGMIIMYSNEKGFIKKQIRLNGRLKLLKEYCLDEKEDFALYIIMLSVD